MCLGRFDYIGSVSHARDERTHLSNVHGIQLTVQVWPQWVRRVRSSRLVQARHDAHNLAGHLACFRDANEDLAQPGFHRAVSGTGAAQRGRDVAAAHGDTSLD